MQNQTSLQFESNVEKNFTLMFKGKLTRKAYAIRIVALIGISLLISISLTTYVTTYLNSISSLDNPMSYSLSLLTPLMTIFGLINLIIKSSFIIRRIQDIVKDVAIWPYALTAVILSYIPFLDYITLIALAIFPSAYLTQEKQEQLLKKFS